MEEYNTGRTDLIRLVQHVALNQSGWWEQAMERLVLACSYTAGPSSRSHLCEAVRQSSGVELTSERFDEIAGRLLQTGSLVEHQESVFVSEAIREDLHAYEEKTMASEERVRTKFNLAAQENGLTERSDELWPVLETEVILPITRYLGARLYELLASPTSVSHIDMSLQIEGIDDRYGVGIRDFFYGFIDPTDHDIRTFVLRRLNAQYAADAAALPAAALNRLAKQGSVPSRVRLVVDTNFLFSILGLHDNPGNEEANKLLQLVEEVRSRVKLQLYVLPITFDESRNVLSDVAVRLSGFRGQPNLAEAAKRTQSLGLAERYLEAASKSPTNLSPSDFFSPYESDLLTVLRSKGVELYNTSLDELRVDQEVIDDVLELSETQRVHRRRGEKSYEANLHDMVLWHFARRERSPSLTSPIEASIWVVTLDYGLLSFERRKLRGLRDQPPICLEPASIIQLFQFWVPSSIELDEALVGSIRQPLLFLNFGVESEQVTLRILAQLSRFDGAGDLSPDVALEILTNEALRQRISSSAENRQTDEEIIGEELLEMIDDLTAARDEARRDARHQFERVSEISPLADAAAQERSRRKEAEKNVRAARSIQKASEGRLTSLAAKVAEQNSQIQGLTDLNTELQDRFEEVDRVQARRKEGRWLALKCLTAVLVSFLLLLGGSVALSSYMATLLAWSLCAALSLLVLLMGVELSLRDTFLAESKLYAGMKLIRKFWWAFAIAVAASLIAAWINELMMR